MSRRFLCPGCQRALRVPADYEGGELTCPRCLAAIQVPVATEAVQAEQPAQARGANCPNCGREVSPQWLLCPHCEEPLHAPRRKGYGAADRDVRRDVRGTSWLMVILAILGVLGIGYAILIASEVATEGDASVLVGVLSGLLFLTLISTLIVFAKGHGDVRSGGVRRVLVGTLALAGGLTALSCALGLAVLIFFFVACLSNPRLFH
jgi:hypothetical protein